MGNKSYLLTAIVIAALGTLGAAIPPKIPSNPGVVTIDHPERFSQVIAISDTHGMYPALLQLLRSNGVIDSNNQWTGGSTLLIVVGDSIDKGPQSVEILDLWISLTSQARVAGGQVLHLLGNHEAEFLSDPTNDQKATELLQELRVRNIPVSDLTDPTSARGSYLRAMPLAARVGKWIFCHAGLLPQMSWADLQSRAATLLSAGAYGDPFVTGNNSILESKGWWGDPSMRAAVESQLDANQAYGLVFGHQPKALFVEGKDAITQDGRIIKIDNGMAPEAGSHPGHLLLFSHPSDLLSAGTPQVTSLTPDGSAEPLAPENLTDPNPSGIVNPLQFD